MATSLLLLLALMPVPGPSSPGRPVLRREQGVLAPCPVRGSEAAVFLADESAAEESEEEWDGDDGPNATALVTNADEAPSSFCLDPTLSPHPLHARDRRGSPRSPPSSN